MSSIIKKTQIDDVEMASFFDEETFYPRLANRALEIQEAQKQALKIVQDAEAQALQSLEKFRAEGIAQGLKEVSPLKGILTSIIAQLKEVETSAAAAFEPVVVGLVLQICKKILGDEVRANPQIIKHTVTAALQSIIDREKIILSIHPDDAKTLEAFQPDIMRAFSDIKQFTLETNPSITRGGCYVKTTRGELDATITTQLEQIGRAYEMELNT